MNKSTCGYCIITVICCWGHQLRNQISTAPYNTHVCACTSTHILKELTSLSGKTAPIKLKILPASCVCIPRDFIEHVTELDAHMAAVAA